MLRHARALGMLAVLLVVAAACAQKLETGFPDPDASPSTRPTATGTGGARTVEVDVADSVFEPSETTVAVGSTVHWTQSGTQPHTVTASDKSFDSHPRCSFADPSTCMRQGGEFSFTFTKPGRFGYYCIIHGVAPQGGPTTGMAGYVVVG